MPQFTKNNGKEILRDYQRNKVWEKVKKFFTRAFWRGMMGLSVVVFIFAGIMSAQVIFIH